MAPDHIVPLRPAVATPAAGPLPLYCVHPVSGSVYPYLPLLRVTGPDQPVYGLEALDYDDDRQPVTPLSELSRRYIRAIDEQSSGQPVCLLGWSMGGVIAFDMASRMHAAGRPPALLIIIDTSVPEPKPVPDEDLLLSLFCADLVGEAGPEAQHELDAVLRTKSQQELDAVLRRRPPGEPAVDAFRVLGEAGLIPDELDVESLSQRYAMFRAHLVALCEYRAPEGYPGPVVAIAGERSSAAGRSWADVALGVEEHTVPGDHYSIWRDGLAGLGEIVRQSLQRARTAISEESTR